MSTFFWKNLLLRQLSMGGFFDYRVISNEVEAPSLS